MIWLASYPRSGSTFLRIVLDEVYGIESSTFHRQKDYPLDGDYATYPVIKTHQLPHELAPADPSIPAVYLVRDGRDCVVSLAHYRKQLLAPESDLEDNLLAAIEAAGLAVTATEVNHQYGFISDSAMGATDKWGVQSISLLAIKTG